jgi:DNA-binding GntR family transcriptional regulator
VITKAAIADLAPVRGAKEYVHEALRTLIVRGTLAPGTPLPLAELAADLDVSTMPVRAALGTLEGEGLVRQLPRRGGAIVAPLDLEDLEEIQALRAGVEALAAQLGAERIDDAGLAELRTLRAAIDEAARAGDEDALLARIFAFHAVCYRAAGRERLLRLIDELERRAERYLRLALDAERPAFAPHLEFQDRLLAACEAHDGAQAAEVLREALAWTLERLRPAVEAHATT